MSLTFQVLFQKSISTVNEYTIMNVTEITLNDISKIGSLSHVCSTFLGHFLWGKSHLAAAIFGQQK